MRAWPLIILSACGALSPPSGSKDGGTRPDAGRVIVEPSEDAGWPVTELSPDSFTETVLPGFTWNDKQSLTTWGGTLFYANSNRVFVTNVGSAWQDVNTHVSVDLLTLRTTPEGPMLLTASGNPVLCDADCRNGALVPKEVPLNFAVFLERACSGSLPLVVRSNRGEYFENRDGGWPVWHDPGARLSPGPCFRLANGDVLTTDDDRINRLSSDGGNRFETPKSSGLPVTDFAQTPFGLVAMAYQPNQLLIDRNGTWESVATPGDTDFIRGFALADGRLVIVGLRGLWVASNGAIRHWAYPRGELDTRRESIAFDANGTVWIVARFTSALGDPDYRVVGYKLRE